MLNRVDGVDAVDAIPVVGFGGSILKFLRLALERVSAVEEGGGSLGDRQEQVEGEWLSLTRDAEGGLERHRLFLSDPLQLQRWVLVWDHPFQLPSFPLVPRRDHQERARSHGKLCFRPHSLPAGCRSPGHQGTRDPNGAHQGREYRGEQQEGGRRRAQAPESQPLQSAQFRRSSEFRS